MALFLHIHGVTYVVDCLHEEGRSRQLNDEDDETILSFFKENKKKKQTHIIDASLDGTVIEMCSRGGSTEGLGNSRRPMGACVSINDDANGKVAEKCLIPTPSRLDGAFVAQSKFGSQYSIASSWTSTGSKEEMFFDARAWQESSSEDDFFSVNGDFVPSGASSPTHRSSFAGFLPAARTLSVSRSSFFKHESPSFTEKKEPLDHGNVLPNPKPKKEIQLVQLFQDRFWTTQAGLVDHDSQPHNHGVTHGKSVSKPNGP